MTKIIEKRRAIVEKMLEKPAAEILAALHSGGDKKASLQAVYNLRSRLKRKPVPAAAPVRRRAKRPALAGAHSNGASRFVMSFAPPPGRIPWPFEMSDEVASIVSEIMVLVSKLADIRARQAVVETLNRFAPGVAST